MKYWCDNHRSKVDVTTDLQAFALVVTAEPYYAVRQPSNVVVIENVVREDTKGATETVNAKYELMERGGYIPTGYNFDPVVLNAKLPLEFFEARNALRIAESEGAAKYASDSYQHAVQLMNTADEYATRKNIEKKPLIAVAREAVQTAEDARAIAVTKIEEERLANERQASADAQAKSQRQADRAIGRRSKPRTILKPRRQAQAESDTQTPRPPISGRQSSKARADAADAQSQPHRRSQIWLIARLLPPPQCLQRRRMPNNPRLAALRIAAGRSKSRSRQTRHARTLVGAIELHSPDSRQRTRPHRQHVRCVV